MSWLIGLLVLSAAALLLARWLRRARRPAAVAPPPIAPTSVEDPSASVQLQDLAARLEGKAEQTTHPRELIDAPDFQRAVELLADPARSDTDLVRHYALGRLWLLASAAYEALARREDRQALAAATLLQLRTFPPGTLHYVLRYLGSLAERPASGTPVLIADAWWAQHSMLIESFREYFDGCVARRDPAAFDALPTDAAFSIDHVRAFLHAVDHAYADALLDELARRQAGRVDEAALTAFGRFWGARDDALLVEPAPWAAALGEAERAVTGPSAKSVLVTGGPRTGKSSFLALLGQRLAAEGWRVFEASTAELMAGQIYFGQLEGRVRQVVSELDVGKRVAWCVGDLRLLAESGTHQGQAASVLDQILPALAAGRLVILAEAELAGATRVLRAHPALSAHFELVRLDPFDDTELRALAAQVGERLEARGSLKVAPAALEAALHFAQQYLQADLAPGAVADVLKRAAELAREGVMTERDVVEAVARTTGLPAQILDNHEPIDLAQVRDYFAERVIGQDEAVATVVDRIAMLKAGLVDPTKPIGVFLFAGPTGTGKTELAKTLAEFLFGSADRLVRLDMSEFQAPDSIAKIVGERGGGAAAGDPLIERVRKQPFSVVLLDEFEKAAGAVWDLFLQVFDDGRLTDAAGHSADFRHTIIILTSNLGAVSHRSSGMGFGTPKDVFTEEQILAAVGRAFRPEFVNRLDRVVVFKPLSRALMYRILRKELAEVLGRRGLRNREWAVEWEPSALDFLLDKGFSPEMGARPLKRAIDQYLLAPLAATLVEHRFPEGDQFLFVRAGGGAIEVEFLDPDAEAPNEPGPAAEAPKRSEAAPTLDLPSLILRPEGSGSARTFLHARVDALAATLASADWAALKSRLAAAAADPEIWSRGERGEVFAAINLVDRVTEAARTVRRLGDRLGGAKTGGEAAARDLVARLALQLWLTEAGVSDALTGAPADAVLRIEPVLDGGETEPSSAWCGRLLGMYRAWAEARRMQHRLVRSGDKPPLLLVFGFGAYRTLVAERGLHVLESGGEPRKRESARVEVAAGPPEEAGAAAALYRALDGALAREAPANRIVRRYREQPSPLVRDSLSGQRSGNLDVVLGGAFDLVFAAGVDRAAPALAERA